MQQDDCIVNLGIDKKMTPEQNEIRKQMRTFLVANKEVLNEHHQRSSFPFEMLPGLRAISAGGYSVTPKKYGGNGQSNVDA